MSNSTSIEKTFVLIKPDGVKRGLTGKIFTKFEDVGLKLVACRMIKPSEEKVKGNYPVDNAEWLTKMGEKTYQNYNNNESEILNDLGTKDKLEIGKKIANSLITYLSSGPIIIMVWEGNHAVNVIRKIVGLTSPDVSPSGTLRGDFGFDTSSFAIKSGRIVFQNLIHTSDSPEEAQREINHWFGKDYKYLGDYDKSDYVGAFSFFN